MGIGGSAISGVALMCQEEGFTVSGCDLDTDTAYLGKVKKSIKRIFSGHDKNHLINADLLVVSPSVLFRNENHPEVMEANKRKILLTWEEFLGKYLHKKKQVICIAGTHGKSTTTAMSGLLFEKANFDPSVIIGAKVKEWEGNFRMGAGDVFITEADEFFDNFLHYYPEVIILNNIEFDHPDYFKSEKDILRSFEKFVKHLVGKKILIVNQDSIGIKRLFALLGSRFLKTISVYGYSLEQNPKVKLQFSAKVTINRKISQDTFFSIKSDKLHLSDDYHLSIPGEYNVANASGVIILSKLFEIKNNNIKSVLKNFRGVGRRLELIGEKNGIKVFDDYAHHPTAIKVTLEALRQKYFKNRIWAVVELHSYSRTKALLNNYKGVFEEADKVIVGPIFKARDNKSFGVTGKDVVNKSGHKDAIYLEDLEIILGTLKNNSKKGDIIIVMGAGSSYKWAREILAKITES